MNRELSHELRRLKNEEPEKLYEVISQLSESEAQNILYDPDLWLRDKQIVKDEWKEPIVLFMMGRGAGKTFLAIQWLRKQLYKGVQGQIMAISRTSSDLRETVVYNGLLEWNHPEWDGFQYEPSKSRVINKDGKAIKLISAEHGAEAVRGSNSSIIWIDELGSITDPAVLDQALLTLRIAPSKCLITTTPRPTESIIKLYNRAVFNDDPPQEGKDVRIISGATSENFENLSEAFKSTIVKTYEGTSLERQELFGELLLENENALWSRELIRNQTVSESFQMPALERVGIGIDPAVSTGKHSDKTGLVVAALGQDGYGYVISEHTDKYTSEGWVNKAISLYDHYSQFAPTSIVVERNQGGTFVTEALQRTRPFLPVDSTFSTASKISRAQPFAMLTEQGKIFFCRELLQLSNELCGYEGSPREKSPDRMDSMVFALSQVMPVRQSFARVSSLEL